MSVASLLVVALVVVALLRPVLSQGTCPQVYPHCQLLNRPGGWRAGVELARPPPGVVAHGQAGVELGGGAAASVHGQRVFGGPNNGAQSVGGAVNYQHPGGLGAKLEVTRNKGHGTSYGGSVGGSAKVGPGTLTVGGGLDRGPAGKPQANVAATYSVP